MSAATGVWAFILLDRTPDWNPWLRWVVLVGSIAVVVVIAVGVHRLGRFSVVVAAAAMLFAGAGSAVYAIETASHASGGPGAMSGPVAAGGFGGPDGPTGPGGPGGPGPGGSVSANSALHELVKAVDNRWAAAGIGSMSTADLELQTGASVMAIGGFAGSDNSPTLAQFQTYVADGQVRYFIAGGHRGPGGETGAAAAITAWVEQHFNATDVGGTTVYDLQA
jgi:hypothetical protein